MEQQVDRFLQGILHNTDAELVSHKGLPVIQIPVHDLLNTAGRLKSDPKVYLDLPVDATAAVSMESGGDQDNIVVYYTLQSSGLNKAMVLAVALPLVKPVCPSLCALWPGFKWHEQQIADRFGVEYLGLAEADLVVADQEPGYPFCHRLHAEKGVITGVDIWTGKCHRGIEEVLEQRSWHQLCQVVLRTGSYGSVAAVAATTLAVETLCEMQVPPRAAAWRMICLELQRVIEHFSLLHELLKAVGNEAMRAAALDVIKGARRLAGDLSGGMAGRGFWTPGGIRATETDLNIPDLSGLTSGCERAIESIRGLLDGNAAWVKRLRESGRVSAESALAAGLTGPCLRAAGVKYDVRRAHPYLLYDEVDFAVASASTGSSLDRLRVRCDEVVSSMRIISQLLSSLPAGPLLDSNWCKIPPAPKGGLCSTAGMIAHTQYYSGATPAAKGRCFVNLESSNGQLLVFVLGDGSAIPARVHIRGPSFALAQAVSELVRGDPVKSFKYTVMSLAIFGGELEY
jgi:NADH-quinone oxidoreductase subunit D